MKYILVLLLAVHAAPAQTGTAGAASISGAVLDAKTLKPVPAALVIASRAGAPPFTRTTKSGGDGAFRIQGLGAGNYRICVQAAGDQSLDPCQWNGAPTGVKLVPPQAAAGIRIPLTPASVLHIQVQDAQKVMAQLTEDGRRPAPWIAIADFTPASLANLPQANYTSTAPAQVPVTAYV